MKYKVHKLNINISKESDRLENFLNNLKGDVIAVIPNVETFFLFYGAKVRSITIIEKLGK